MGTNLTKLLQIGKKHGASDLFLRHEKALSMKVNGRILPLPQMGSAVSPKKWVDQVLATLFTEDQIKLLKKKRSCDISYKFEDIGYMRIHAFYTNGAVDLVFRYLSQEPPEFGNLNLPPIIQNLAHKIESGLVLVCGKTGQGKSTTALAWLNELNQNFEKHIVTLENPMEMVYKDKKSIFSQRSLGNDFLSFEDGIKEALRSSPDVIFLGEMRDQATIEAALTAAETGHLVISTVHASSSVDCINRLYGISSSSENLRNKISHSFQAIIAQALIPSKENNEMIPAVEVLTTNGVVVDYIKKSNFEGLKKYLDASKHLGMQSMDNSLTYLVQKNAISLEDALKRSENPEALESKISSLISTDAAPKQHASAPNPDDSLSEFQNFVAQQVMWKNIEPLDLKEASGTYNKKKKSG